MFKRNWDIRKYPAIFVLVAVALGCCSGTNERGNKRNIGIYEANLYDNKIVVDGKKIPRLAKKLGWVDGLRTSWDKITLSGWSADLERKIPASSIIVFVDNKRVFRVRPNRFRDELADKYGQEVRNCGFQFIVSLRNIEINSHSTIRVFGEYDESMAAELNYGANAPYGVVDDEIKNKPNILLISLDALRSDHLRSYGYKRRTSPFLDKLADEGVLFRNSFINCLATPSSHPTMLSSLYQKDHLVDLVGDTSDYSVSENVVLLQEHLKNSKYITIGGTGGLFLTAKYGYSRGFDEFITVDDWHCDVAVGSERILESYSKYRFSPYPKFIFFHTYELHYPYKPPLKFRKNFDKTGQNIYYILDLFPTYRDHPDQIEENELSALEDLYDDEIFYTDYYLEHFFDKLEEAGFFDRDYLVVITADHGEEFGDHGSLDHLGRLYEELIKVPLIVKGKNLPGGKKIDSMVESVDILPTVLDYAGIETNMPMRGRSLNDLILEKDIEEKQVVFSQFRDWRYAVRGKEWKLIQNFRPEEKLELYNLLEDPKERTNLVESQSDIAQDLLKLLESWKSDVIDIKALASLIKLERQSGQKKPDETELNKELEKLRALGYIK
jgi:arylsulfatase A-like enzyme